MGGQDQLTFRAEKDAEDLDITVDKGQHCGPPDCTQGHFYSFDFFGPIEDLAKLLRLLQKYECPKVGAQEWAQLSAGGRLGVAREVE